MKLYSTNLKSRIVSFREAVLRGLAEDGGLFMPQELPRFSEDFFRNVRGRSFQDISFSVAETLLGEEIPSQVLERITYDALNFDVPLVRLSEDKYVLELFHGPTLAFKDVGARFMARVMAYFVRDSGRELTILVATSGDTGAAVAHGFLSVPGVRVFILYPSGKVSKMQEKMLTTMGGNITALEIDGTFDDCQRLSKEAFLDQELRRKLFLSSANSINIARLIPQTFYYFYAWSQLPETEKPIVISVPSGNFGNLTAGLFAKRMGLSVVKFIAATNANNVVPRYLETGKFVPRPSVKTFSNAMDVGSPSNFSRILALYENDVEKMRQDLWGRGFSDEETRSAMREAFDKYGYILEPHGAVGYLGLQKYRAEYPDESVGIFLETAHPAKFKGIVDDVLGKGIPVPIELQEYLQKEKQAIPLSNLFFDFKEFLSAST